MSDRRLPRLLAPYRKYGSFAEGWPVLANHFCKSGALVETTKNGTPTTIASSISVDQMGLEPAGVAHPETLNGPLMRMSTSGKKSKTPCIVNWRRNDILVLTECV